MRVAVVDFGTNSTRLLVADVEDGQLAELERRSTVTRLGDGVDASGRLSEVAMERVFAAVAEYRGVIDTLGAERVVAVATSAVRDAANGEEFLEALRERFGIDVRTISGDEEARLTFLGATAGRSPDGGETLVHDIGGGSTEYVLGVPGSEPDFHVSTQVGSVRQTERHLHHDPPKPGELATLAEEVRTVIDGAVPRRLREQTTAGIAVAGTATTLAAIDLGVGVDDHVHGHRLRLPSCERILAMLAALPLAERRAVRGLHPDRAPTIVAGAVILVESMRAFGLDAMEVSEADILQGAALAEVVKRREDPETSHGNAENPG